jgi:hypothetical protein
MIKTIVSFSVFLASFFVLPGEQHKFNHKEVFSIPKVNRKLPVMGSSLIFFQKKEEIKKAVILTPDVVAAWNKVAWCETHSNWQHKGYLYEGGLGILHSNWAYYGGYKYAPHAWLATPEQQITVAIKIQHGLPTPDKYSCAAW